LEACKKLELFDTLDSVYQEVFDEVRRSIDDTVAFVSFSPTKGKGRYLCVTKKGSLSQI
jgi:hypothetical protein